MLVDRLEAVINGGWRPPMSTKVMIDEREALDVLDLMRTAIPDEIKQSRRVNQERDKILSQAQIESNRVIAQAQERSQRLISEEGIRVLAEEQARQVLQEAHREAEDVRRGADEYAMEMLQRLDDQLQRVQSSVRNATNAMATQPHRSDNESATEDQ